jgi:hypothetical protein
MDPAARAASGISRGLLRLSVGIEDGLDLWEDLERALNAELASPVPESSRRAQNGVGVGPRGSAGVEVGAADSR